jgi:multimeric flavodoxin WrbA
MYGPSNLSERAAVALRRYVWALNASMGQAVETMVISLPGYVNSTQVCAACKDNTKCNVCVFKTGAELPENAAALLYS